LNFIRRGVKTWVAKALLGLLILSFAVWGIGGEIFSFSFSTPVARVGDTKVTAEEYSRALQREQNRLAQQAGEAVSLETMRQLEIDERILSGLMRDAAFDEELAGIGVRVPDTAALQAIAGQPEFQNPDGSLARTTVELYMNQLGMTEAQFIDLNRRLIGQNLLSAPAIAATSAPPGMAARLATYQGETRRVETTVLPLSLAADPGTPIDAELANFYDANPERYTEPERRSGKYLSVDINALIESAQPTEDDVRATYDAEAATFTAEPAREINQMSFPDMIEAEAAVARIRSGETTFEDLAAERGEDLASLYLGWVTDGDVPSATADAIFGTEDPGILDPVQLPVGTVLIQVRDVRLGGVIPYEEIKDQIALRLAQDTAYTRSPDLANQIEELRAGGAALDEIAREVELPLETFDRLGADGSLPDGGATDLLLTSDFLQEAFEAFEGEERQIIETADGGFLLILIDEIDDGGLQSLEAVRDRVLVDWQNDRRLRELETRATKMTGQIDGDATLAALSGALGLEVSEHAPFTRETGPTLLPQAIVDAAFAQTSDTGVLARLDDGSGVMVGEITGSVQLPPELAQETSAQLDELIVQTIRGDAREYLARAITARHETGTDPVAIDEVFTYLTGYRTHGGGY
ncbi:MAG: SurA N-terminal domain-containing protein, partial [Pseudomonadota bacterium]